MASEMTPEKFAIIDRERPEIYAAFAAVVNLVLATGRRKPIGAVWALYEARYRYRLKGVTNDVAPYLARKWLRCHPHLPKTIFERRSSRADAPAVSLQTEMWL